MNSLLNNKKEDIETTIKAELAAGRRITIAMDGWSKKGLTASFLAVSASFYSTLQLKPLHVLLNLHQVTHPHTGEMLADKLRSSLGQWDIDTQKVLMVVTDNGSNMVKAIKSIAVDRPECHDRLEDESDMEDGESEEDEEEVEDPEPDISLHRLPCVAHTLQLVLKEIEKNDGYKNLVQKCRGIVKGIRVSSVATEKLIAKCGKTVIVDCTTRWNSVYLMISRLVEIKGALNEVLEDMKVDSLTFTEWSRLTELCRLLQPFREQTDLLQSDNLSLSCVIPSLLELSLHLQDSTFTKSLALPLLQSLRRRFAVFLEPSSDLFDPLAATACLLDPTVMTTMLRNDMAPLLHAAKSRVQQEV